MEDVLGAITGERGRREEFNRDDAVQEVVILEEIQSVVRERIRHLERAIREEQDTMTPQEMEGMMVFDQTGDHEYCRKSRSCVASPRLGESTSIIPTTWNHCFRTDCFTDW